MSKKWAEDMNRHFSKEDIQMTNRHMKKKMFIITSHQGDSDQNHTEIPPVRMAKINRTVNSMCWRECGVRGNLTLLVGVQVGAATLENSVEIA